jgi:hypothetical protein
MERRNEKKLWQKPELIVLVRSRPDEAVLETCKSSGRTTGESHYKNNCMKENSSTCPQTCQSIVGS